MKDYHDLLVMISEPDFLSVSRLSGAIQATFNRRGTSKILTIQFDKAGMQNLQTLWSRHLRGLGIFRERLNLPENISSAIDEINNWISLNRINQL